MWLPSYSLLFPTPLFCLLPISLPFSPHTGYTRSIHRRLIDLVPRVSPKMPEHLFTSTSTSKGLVVVIPWSERTTTVWQSLFRKGNESVVGHSAIRKNHHPVAWSFSKCPSGVILINSSPFSSSLFSSKHLHTQPPPARFFSKTYLAGRCTPFPYSWCGCSLR